MPQVHALARHGFSIGTGLFDSLAGERIVLPFRRPGPAIAIVALMALIMTVPALQVFRDATRSWRDFDGLFDLTTALFQTGWLLGWCMGLLVLYGLLAILWLGRETLLLRPGAVELRIGLPVLFLRVRLDPARISALRHQVPEPDSGTAWRGPHLVFDYDGTNLQLGSNLDAAAAGRLAGQIRALPVAPASRPPGDCLITPQQAPDTGTRANDDAAGPATVISRDAAFPVSSLALIAANLVPVAGVLLFGWDLGKLMVLFWAESGVIGCFHLLKMAVVQRWLVLFTGPLFIGHFGAFMAVHFLFVYELFVSREAGIDSSLADVGQFLLGLWPALLALTLSHGLSFFDNILGHAEYRGGGALEQMSEPYRRIMIMHLTVIIGGGLSLLLGVPTVALLLLVALKIAADISAHRKQHHTTPFPGRQPDKP